LGRDEITEGGDRQQKLNSSYFKFEMFKFEVLKEQLCETCESIIQKKDLDYTADTNLKVVVAQWQSAGPTCTRPWVPLPRTGNN
jgi:hypothetical protein